MTFMEVWQDIWVQFYGLVSYEMSFPEPIGLISPFDITAFFAVAYMLADTVSMVASRRD